MENIKIKLMSSYSPLDYGSYDIPYGLGVVSAFMRKHNYNVLLDDLSVKIEEHNKRFLLPPAKKVNLNLLKYEKKKIIAYLMNESADKRIEQFADDILKLSSCSEDDLVGISVMSYLQFMVAAILAKRVKSLQHSKKIVLGGPFITIYGKRIFEDFTFFDYMITGDGQFPLLKLAEHLQGNTSIHNVPNLIYKHNGKIVENFKKNFPIDDLFIPDFSGINLNSYLAIINKTKKLALPYQISRGCISRCNFCARGALHPVVEFKSQTKVVNEIKMLKERYKSSFFFFRDEAINCSYKYLDSLCERFIEEKLNIFWEVYARPDNLDKNILNKMKQAGCFRLCFGVESASNVILERMDKGFNTNDASEVLKTSYNAGISNNICIIVGYPHETKEDIEKTVNFIKKHSKYINKILLRFFAVIYGTPIYNNPADFGIENLRYISDTHRKLCFTYFFFDETGGLKWEKKVKEAVYYGRIIMEAYFRFILSRKHCFIRLFFPLFWVYLWLRYFWLKRNGSRLYMHQMADRLYIAYCRNWIFRIFRKLIFMS